MSVCDYGSFSTQWPNEIPTEIDNFNRPPESADESSNCQARIARLPHFVRIRIQL